MSFAGSTGITLDPAFEHIHEPGGFRRNYVLLQGAIHEEREPPRILNFIEFLYLFGHFVSSPCFVFIPLINVYQAGEDLEELEEEEDEGAIDEDR